MTASSSSTVTTPTSEELKALAQRLRNVGDIGVGGSETWTACNTAADVLIALEIKREGMREVLATNADKGHQLYLRLSVAEGAMRLAALWFRQYETQHRAKGTEDGNDKAARNADRAQHLEAVIGAITPKPDT